MKRLARVLAGVWALAVTAQFAAGAEMTGKDVFNHYCVYCHGAGDRPGTMQLGRTRGADKAVLQDRSDLPPDYIRMVVRHGLKSMPPFTPSDLTDAKLESLIRFLTTHDIAK